MKKRPAITGQPYRCNVCRVVVLRDSTKHWLKSLCERTGRNARLYQVRPQAVIQNQQSKI
jgi:hypothetical protein